MVEALLGAGADVGARNEVRAVVLAVALAGGRGAGADEHPGSPRAPQMGLTPLDYARRGGEGFSDPAVVSRLAAAMP